MSGPQPYYEDESVTLHLGDCLAVLPTLPDASVDAVVCDPPYGLEFMGKEWDGADGFRRSLNEADAGRGSVFGRTSKTSPEYKTGKPSAARIRKRTDARTNPVEGKSETNTPEAYVAGQPFQRWCEAWATECLRVLKPGGHLLAFGGTRTWHRLACAIEDAGFEIRDSMSWIYGSGFPKSLDVSKAIDKRRDWAALPLLQAKVRAARLALGISQSEAARRCGIIEAGESLGGGGFMWFETGMRIPTAEQYPRLKAALGLDGECDRAFEEAEREVTGTVQAWSNRTNYALTSRDGLRRDVAATDAAEEWTGWGTALKPAHEPIAIGRKPLAGTVAANVLAFGTGALNIAGCRVAHANETDRAESEGKNRHADFGSGPRDNHIFGADERARAEQGNYDGAAGRWPSNVLLDPAAAAELDRQSGATVSRVGKPRRSDAPGDGYGMTHTGAEYADAGGASRFFPVFRYEAKAGASERPRSDDGTAHPTVKPVDLMAWLVRLVTPPGGTVLDPFGGSGTTAEACIVEGFQCVLIERDPAYAELIKTRLRKPIQPVMFGMESAS